MAQINTAGIYGKPLVDAIVNTTDAFATLSTLLGYDITKLGSGERKPLTALLSIKENTNDAIFGFGGTAEHALVSTTTTPAIVPIHGPDAITAMKLKSASAGNAAAVSVTIFY